MKKYKIFRFAYLEIFSRDICLKEPDILNLFDTEGEAFIKAIEIGLPLGSFTVLPTWVDIN